MDILLILMILVFFGIVGGLAFFLFKEQKNTQTPSVKEKILQQNGLPRDSMTKKQAAALEERIKTLEAKLDETKVQLTESLAKTKQLEDEKSHVNFDSQQYEKMKNDYYSMKKEIAQKEEALEQEISARRKENQELNHLRADFEALKVEKSKSDDERRKAETAIETMTKEMNQLKQKVSAQEKIVNEHAQTKEGGQWVAREEFVKIEKELQEKEALLQKLLSVKKNEQNTQ